MTKKKLSPAKQSAVFYDDALPTFTSVVLEYLGDAGLAENCFLRDADGNLTYILLQPLDEKIRKKLSAAVKRKLGSYVTEMPVATPNDLFDPSLVKSSQERFEYVSGNHLDKFVRLIERRIVGQDWVRGIQPKIPKTPPIVVFASHKGGVGRSTALAIAAAEFARRGHSILAIDADLEAPGLGEMFIAEDKRPLFGALDYFVENGRGTVDRNFLAQMRAPSTLTRGRGRVSVIPAVGTKCRDYPQNVIGKISRAYLDDISPNGESASLLDQMRSMIESLCAQQKYDAIFIDARAGLNETTAATVQGLGADVLFFGVDTPQTWDGYRYFLAHLARFKSTKDEADWRFRLKMVHAKATNTERALASFRDNAFELFAEHLYDEVDESKSGSIPSFGFDLDDSAAPHFAWPIFMSASYYEFDPLARPKQLSAAVYNQCFKGFITNLADRLEFT